MQRIVVIGGSGHIGSYLIPALAEQGFTVVTISRGKAKPYRPHYAWQFVEQVTLDRTSEENSGQFGSKIAALKPDAVIDLLAFALPSVQQLVNALRGQVSLYLCCSSIWVYGAVPCIPCTEMQPVNPIDNYGRGKAAIEQWLMQQAQIEAFPATCFRPGHIVGEGWPPINPQGNANSQVFKQIARGDTLVLPNLGLETLHHVHAQDVAQWILCALRNRSACIGEVFNCTSEQAVTLRGYAEAAYQWFGQKPQLNFLPFNEWIQQIPAADRDTSCGHVLRSSCLCMEKSRQRLGFVPRYSSLAACYQSVQGLPG